MDWNQVPQNNRLPNFNNLLAVLRREVPERPTLFEFFLNERLYQTWIRDGYEKSGPATYTILFMLLIVCPQKWGLRWLI